MRNGEERKLEVFIGATREDLKEARTTVIEAVLEASHIPSGMELWSAGATPTRGEVGEYLKRCDIHIVILGARYGYVPPGLQRSFTEWEFDQSSQSKRPVLAFLLEDQEFKISLKKELRKLSTPKERRRLEAAVRRFRERLRKSRVCRFFSNTPSGREKLGRMCSNAIKDLISWRRLPESAGWMRANEADVGKVREVRRNKFLEKILDRLHEFTKLTERTLEQKGAKDALARVFWEVMIGRIKRKNYRHIFVESGSTLAHVSDHFLTDAMPNLAHIEEWAITTNNVVTLLLLLLHSNIKVTPLPAAAPDPKDKYGAIFPPEALTIKQTKPRRPRPLYHQEEQTVRKLADALREGRQHNKLFLAATSGLDLAHEKSHFRGPHVGSHANMLFKRAIFRTGCPVALCLSASKFGERFVVGKCYPVFGPDFAWNDALKRVPLAVCVGYENMAAKTSPPRRNSTVSKLHRELHDPTLIKQKLEKLGLDASYDGGESESGGAVIAANAAFKRIFPPE